MIMVGALSAGIPAPLPTQASSNKY